MVTLMLALGLAGAVSGCETIQQASDTANSVSNGIDKSKACLEAVRLVGFTPDLSDPQKALEETRQKAEELTKLSEQTGDTALRDVFSDTASTMGSVNSAADWVKQKTDLVAKVSEACG